MCMYSEPNYCCARRHSLQLPQILGFIIILFILYHYDYCYIFFFTLKNALTTHRESRSYRIMYILYRSFPVGENRTVNPR